MVENTQTGVTSARIQRGRGVKRWRWRCRCRWLGRARSSVLLGALGLGAPQLALGAPPTRAHVIPPGKEADARELLADLGWDRALRGGYRFDRLAIEDSTVRLILADANGEPVGVLHLSPRGPDTPPADASESFAVAMEVGPGIRDERVAALLAEAAASVRAHDRGGFYVTVPPPANPENELADAPDAGAGEPASSGEPSRARDGEAGGRSPARVRGQWISRIAVVLGLALLGALVSLRSRGEPATRVGAPLASAGRSRAVWALLGTCLVFVYLLALTPHPMLHMDTARDLLMARDLAEGRALYLYGVRASVAELRQGASWLDMLAIVRALGGGVDAARYVGLALQALAIVLGQLVLLDALALPRGRRGDGEAGLLAVALLWLVPWLNEGPVLWQMAALPVAVVVVHGALLRVLVAPDGGRSLDAAVAGLLAGLACDLHLVCIVLVPWVLAFSLIFARRAALAGIVATLSMAVAPLLLSPETVAHDLDRVIELLGAARALALVGGGAAMVVVASLAVRGRAQALDRRSRLIAYAAAGTAVLALVIALSLALEPLRFAPRYLSPLAFTAVLGLGLVLGRRDQRARRRSIAAGIALALLTHHAWRAQMRVEAGQIGWRIAEVEELARLLEERGWTLDEVSAGLSGTDGYRLLTTLGVFMRTGEDRGRRALVLLREREAAGRLAAETGGEWVELDRGRGLVLIEGAGVDRRRARCCVGAGPEPACTAVDPPPAEARWHDRSRPTAWRDGDRLETWIADQRAAGIDADSLSWHVSAGGAAHLVATASATVEPGCGWRFVLDDRPPDPQLELGDEFAAAHARALEVALTRSPSCSDGYSLFPPIEFDLAVPEP